MLELAQSLAQLTAHRDRGALDHAAVDLLASCVPDAQIRMYRCVGPPADQRLLLTAFATAGVTESVTASLRVLDELPPLASDPLFLRALHEHAPLHDCASGRHVFSLELDSHCIAFVDLQSARGLDATHTALIQTLLTIYCNQIALLDYGETDALTGLLNRKTYDAMFCRAARSSSQAEPQSLVEMERRSLALRQWMGVIDVDHFKRVNDTHGHLIGDELLLMVAQLMRATFRYGDALYRFGGEEFVVLLRAPDREHARIAFERFRRRLAGQNFPRVGKVTVSIGFTAIRDHDLPSAAFERADRAVYFAKEHGRNQVRCFDDLLDGGAVESQEHVGEVELF
jgi:diguanylate cyclase (GGDEF)-like protein